jgi:hypothetical protein
MPLDGILCPRIQRMPPLIGPTLVGLGNTQRNALRKPPRHHTVLRNNRILHSKTMKLNISHPRSANNGTEKVESSSCGNCGAK